MLHVYLLSMMGVTLHQCLTLLNLDPALESRILHVYLLSMVWMTIHQCTELQWAQGFPVFAAP